MRQRIIIATALLTDPDIIIADEPTTALDVTIQAEIMDLIIELCETDDMGLILITHDLAVVSQVTENIAVMYAGRIVEKGRTKDVVMNSAPIHARADQALPEGAKGNKRLNQIPGMMPTLTNIPSGCSFHPRCPHVMDICTKYVPELIKVKDMSTEAACVLCSVKTTGGEDGQK